MPLWAIVYMVLVAFVGAAAAIYDVRSKASSAYVACDVLATLGLLLMVLAYWHEPAARFLGRGALPLVLLVLAWEIYSTAKEWPRAPSASESMQWIWVVLAAFFYAPAFAAGAAITVRAW